MEILKILLGVPLFALVCVLLYHGLLIGWGFASDFRSRVARTVARCLFVLVAVCIVAGVGAKIVSFFA